MSIFIQFTAPKHPMLVAATVESFIPKFKFKFHLILN